MCPFYSIDIPGDIICAGQNSIFSCTCRLLRESGFASLLDECDGRRTLFAPTNQAWNRLFGQCPTRRFGDNRLFATGNQAVANANQVAQGGVETANQAVQNAQATANQAVQNAQATANQAAQIGIDAANQAVENAGGRGLQQPQDNSGLRRLIGYHIVDRVIPFTQLSCGDDRSIQMSRAGTSETRCRRNSPFAQQGTCNTEANLPTFINAFSASNGGIYSVDNVLIPSPDGTLAGCTGIINGQCSTNNRCNTRNKCETRDECSGDWLSNNGNACCRRENIINNGQCSTNNRCNTRNNCESRDECSGDWLPTDTNNINNNNNFCCRRNTIINDNFFNCVCDDNQCVNQIRFKYTRRECDNGETQSNDNRRSNYCEDIFPNPRTDRNPNPPRPTYKVYECGVTDFPEIDVVGDQQLPRDRDDTVILDVGPACLPNCITIEIRERNQNPNPNRITQRFNINTGFNDNVSSNCENVLVRNQDYGAFETVNNNNAFNCRNF